MAENAAAINVLGTRQADLHLMGPSGFTGLHLLAQSETSIACIDIILRLGASVTVYDEVCVRVPPLPSPPLPTGALCDTPAPIPPPPRRRSARRLTLRVSGARSVSSSACTLR